MFRFLSSTLNSRAQIDILDAISLSLSKYTTCYSYFLSSVGLNNISLFHSPAANYSNLCIVTLPLMILTSQVPISVDKFEHIKGTRPASMKAHIFQRLGRPRIRFTTSPLAYAWELSLESRRPIPFDDMDTPTTFSPPSLTYHSLCVHVFLASTFFLLSSPHFHWQGVLDWLNHLCLLEMACFSPKKHPTHRLKNEGVNSDVI